MYETGALVLYGKRGVYQVESVGPSPVRGAKGDYYKLRAVFSNSDEVAYTPVEADSVMRSLVSCGEAARSLERFARMEPPVFRSGKLADMTAHYRELLASRRVEDCLLLIKELHIRQRELTRQKKRLGQADAQYLKTAERLICEEFAVALDTTPERIRERLYADAEHRATA